jgi:hypothetical protein
VDHTPLIKAEDFAEHGAGVPWGWRHVARRVALPVLVALALRLVVVAFLYPNRMNPRRDHWPFAYECGKVASAIVAGRGFSDPFFAQTGPSAIMGPTYPYLLAGIFKVFGVYTATSAIVALSLGCLFSALTCVPIFLLARESFGERVGLYAAWAWAFFPYAILYAAERIWETCLTTLFVTWLVLLAICLGRTAKKGAWLGFGLLWGVAGLTSPSVLSLAPFLGGWACYRLRARGERWITPAMAAALVCVCTILPWGVRNYRVFHKVIPVRDNFWQLVWEGNHGNTALYPVVPANPPTSEAENEEFNRLGEIEYMAAKRRGAVAFIKTHPGWVALVSLRRVVVTWTGAWSLPHWPLVENFDPEEPFDPAHVIFYTALSVLAFAGLWRTFAERVDTRWLFAFVLGCFPLVYYLTLPRPPYRHPMEPEIVILAVYAVATWRGNSGRRLGRVDLSRSGA